MSLFANTLVTSVLFGTIIVILIAWGIVPRGDPAPPLMRGPWKNLPQPTPERRTATVWVPAEWAARQSGR
jgi:hypothetical protein